MVYNWVPVFGEFEIGEGVITFMGRRVEWRVPPDQVLAGTEGQESQTRSGPAYGVTICDQHLTDGTVSATLEFDSVTPDTGCDLMLAYDVETRYELSVGLIGHPAAMYHIRERAPGKSPAPGTIGQAYWSPLAIGGGGNLKAKRPYHIQAQVSGSRVALYVDEVHVASATVGRSHGRPKQVGISCSAYAPIRIFDFKVQTEKPKAFMVMQFGDPYDNVYSEVIKQVCDDYKVEVLRADDVYGPGVIIADVIQQIVTSQLIIADITPPNPNVYFEVGFALAMNKPMILLAKKGTALPFDLSAFRVLFYEDTIAGKSRIEEGLRRHLKAMLGSV